MPYIQQHKNTLKKSRPQLYNRRRVGGGGSDLSGSLLVFLGVWHLDRHNLHALRTRPKRNHNHNPEAWNHERLGISASAAGSFKISQTCRITVERGRWRVVKKRSHHASLRTPKIGTKYQINFWLASLHWIHSYPADLVNVVTGRIAPETVNTHDAVDIGNEQLISFEKSRPDGFCALFYPSWYWPRQVANFGKNNVHDTNLIYSQVLRVATWWKVWQARTLLSRLRLVWILQCCQRSFFKVCWWCTIPCCWSARIQWNWQLFPSLLLVIVELRKDGTWRLCQSQSPLGLGGRTDKGSWTLCPNVAAHSSCNG